MPAFRPASALLPAAVCVLSACSSLPADPAPEQRVDLAAARAIYHGPIDWYGVHRLQSLAGSHRLKVLEIDSRGGDAEAAMALGSWIHRQGMNLEVSRLCLENCANYLFPAANKKLIQPGAIVAWQGNLQYRLQQQQHPAAEQPRPAAMSAEALNALRKQVSLEELYFQRLGVDPRVCWIGKLPPYNARGAFVLPPEDLRRFNISGVRTEKEYSARSVARWQTQFAVEKIVLPYGGAL